MKQHAYGQCAAVMTSLASLLYCSKNNKNADNINKENRMRPSSPFISDIIASNSSAITISKLCALALHAAECITHTMHNSNNKKIVSRA